MENEMTKRTWIVCAALALVLAAACSPAAPTADPAQIQASAVAAASTMIAMTQAAIPTATEIPPTEPPTPTPLPSPTPLELPTLAFTAPTVAPTAASGDDCNHLFDLGETGNARSPVKVNNNNKGTANLSLGMFQKNAFGQCGYLAFQIKGKDSAIISMPQTGTGPCWYGYAWVNGSNPSTAEGGPFCWNNPDKWTLDIYENTIKLTPP
jgi:hypothetical protein